MLIYNIHFHTSVCGRFVAWKCTIWCHLHVCWIWLIALIKSINRCIIWRDFLCLAFIPPRFNGMVGFLIKWCCFCNENTTIKRTMYKEVECQRLNEWMEDRKKDALNRICLIKSIVILINSTKMPSLLSRFRLLWDWDSGGTLIWHFLYALFAHS